MSISTQNSKLKTQNDNSKLKTNLKYRCYYFSIEIINFINSLPQKKVVWIISDQLLRCSTSIGANVIEAKSSSSRKDFIHFYQIALKSANETKYWLCLLRNTNNNNVNRLKIKKLIDETDEISKMLASSIITLKNKKI
ncbi:MAG: four helix bundle protein [Patescibacteria group bacterium]|nr:four helix bundle protein [Patescibacteria group bacterium]